MKNFCRVKLVFMGKCSPELTRRPILIIFGALERWEVEVFCSIFLVLLYTTENVQSINTTGVSAQTNIQVSSSTILDSESLHLAMTIEPSLPKRSGKTTWNQLLSAEFPLQNSM